MMASVTRLRTSFTASRSVRQSLAARGAIIRQCRRLAELPLFAACSRRELRTLVRWGDEVEVPGGVVILRENASGSCFVVVLAGRLTLTRGGRAIGSVGPGGWTGDIAILGFGPQPATVTTATTSRVFALGPRALLSFAVPLPGLRAGLFPGLTERDANQRVRDLRAQARPLWRQLRDAGPRDPGPVPSWLRTYRSSRTHPATVPEARHAHRLLSTGGRAPPPVRGLVGTVLVWATIAIGAAGLGVATIPLPYYSCRGGIRSATDLTHVSAHATYPPRGRILFPVVEAQQDTTLDVLRDWYDPNTEVRDTTDVLGGQTQGDADRANLRLMDESKRTATSAAFSFLGSDIVDRGAVAIDTRELGGPSGGLAFALALIDDLTPGELTAGLTVVATGTIAPDGTVGTVGGLRLKTLAARRARADLLLVPSADLHEVQASAGPLRVVGVSSLTDAVNALMSLGGEATLPPSAG